MRPPRERVYRELVICQARYGGYTGEDVTKIAGALRLWPNTLRRWLKGWQLDDPRFRSLKYLSQRTQAMTLDDFECLEERLRNNPSEVKSYLLNDLNTRRAARGEASLDQATFYRQAARRMDGAHLHTPTAWLESHGIPVGPDWTVTDARASLDAVFNYSQLKFHAGISLTAFSQRLGEARAWFSSRYPGVDSLNHYPVIRPRSKLLRGQLSTMAANEMPDVQARLSFETQATFLVDAGDRYLSEALLRRGRLHQSRRAARAAQERELQGAWVKKAVPAMNAVVFTKGETLGELKGLALEGATLASKAREAAFLKNQEAWGNLWRHVSDHTQGYSGDVLEARSKSAGVVLELVRDPSRWSTLPTDDRRRVSRDPETIRALDGGSTALVKAVTVDRFLRLLKAGEIVDQRSWQYGDLSTRLSSFSAPREKDTVERQEIEALLSGTYAFPPVPKVKVGDMGESLVEEDEGPSFEGEHITPLLKGVSEVVSRHNAGWWDSHQATFRRQSDGMLRMNYAEGEYRNRLYEVIGFLGRNMRYSDSEAFQGMEYFVLRHLSDEVLDLEMAHQWEAIRALSGRDVNLVIIDTMGIDSRRKSFFATHHGRYHTVGLSDLRAVADTLIPVFSMGCPATDSEAMNILEVLGHAKRVLGESLRWYTGNAHTVSRLAAGMAFAAYGIIAAGRIHGEPKLPGRRCRERLLRRVDLINRMGWTLRADPSLGRMLASHQKVMVDGVNVRKLLEDLGSTILWAERQAGIKLDHLSQLIETSNRQKRVVQIMERGVRRLHEENVSLGLKATELVLSSGAIWKLHQGRGKLEVGESLTSMKGIVMFIPA